MLIICCVEVEISFNKYLFLCFEVQLAGAICRHQLIAKEAVFTKETKIRGSLKCEIFRTWLCSRDIFNVQLTQTLKKIVLF